MARSRKKVVVEEPEEDELDELEDLEDLEDDDEAEEDDEEEEDEDEAPKARRKKTSKAKSKPKKASGAIGSRELADELGTDGKNLRVMLRDQGVQKNETGRYEWESLEDALEAMGFEDLEEAQEALAESRNK